MTQSYGVLAVLFGSMRVSWPFVGKVFAETPGNVDHVRLSCRDTCRRHGASRGGSISCGFFGHFLAYADNSGEAKVRCSRIIVERADCVYQCWIIACPRVDIIHVGNPIASSLPFFFLRVLISFLRHSLNQINRTSTDNPISITSTLINHKDSVTFISSIFQRRKEQWRRLVALTSSLWCVHFNDIVL